MSQEKSDLFKPYFDNLERMLLAIKPDISQEQIKEFKNNRLLFSKALLVHFSVSALKIIKQS